MELSLVNDNLFHRGAAKNAKVFSFSEKLELTQNSQKMSNTFAVSDI